MNRKKGFAIINYHLGGLGGEGKVYKMNHYEQEVKLVNYL